MTLDEALHYIHAVCWKGSIPGLERISALLDKMGHPERTLKFVHVTGTNGKGSTCAMLASILRAAGYRTGLYTSPHFVSPVERIRLDGVPLPEEDWPALADEVYAACPELTYFEFLTVLALLAFARHGVEMTYDHLNVHVVQ